MQKILRLLIIALGLTLFACDNEVDLSADFEDTTVVYSLLNVYDSVQYVKVNKAFLKDGENAIDLAKDADNLFYEGLDVRLIRPDRKDTFVLQPREVPKDPGVFSTEKNIVFYTNQPLRKESAKYDLYVTQSDGKQTTSSITALESVPVTRPGFDNNSNRRPVSFVRQIGGGLTYQDYEFLMNLNSNIAEVEVKIFFKYTEVVNGNNIPRTVEIPVGGVVNSELKNEQFGVIYDGENFYRSLSSLVPKNSNKKIVDLTDNIIVYVTAVDVVFNQYTFIYGPLDGLAQVRPEYTNINNGVGIFASRSTTTVTTRISDISRQELFTGQYTSGFNFSNP